VTKRRELSRVTFVLTRGIRRDGRVDNMDDADRIRWAPKVRQPKICQLYQRDAAGIVDEELIDDVGMALYERCRSILLVSNAQVECPRCGRVFHVGWGHASDDVITCPGVGCSWRTTSDQYHSSWRHRDLIGTRAAADLEAFVEQYPRAASPRGKMLLIDRLIHAFHQGIKAGVGHRSLANNLIEGSHEQVVAFLDRLAYGEGSSPEVRETWEQFHANVSQMWRLRRTRKS
jgi:hypothetical protein